MNIDDLTFGEIKQLTNMFCNNTHKYKSVDKHVIGEKAIIRTYSAGVHFGEVIEKVKDEIILKNARRLYYWKTLNNGISLSEIANHGVHNNSKICETVPLIWLKPIEIIICSDKAINSIEDKDVYKA